MVNYGRDVVCWEYCRYYRYLSSEDRHQQAMGVIAASVPSMYPKSCHSIVPCTEFLIKELARIPRDVAQLSI